ncbi:MAG TPA: transcriptional regulator GcvA [Verrucomicrobiae bacterium]|nr:transcriptional regulator GcvA [Verrucomicrobiae bacterium]
MSPTHAKRRREVPLELLRGFEASARHLSFTKAADELFLTQSAISRQVQGLEEALGVPLFQRRHRALLLTDEGQILAQTVARLLGELGQTVERLSGSAGGMITVTTMVTFASLWLVPRLAKFRQVHPLIDVRIAANNELLDLERDRIDVAIRYVAPDRAPAGATQLFGEEVVPVCAPALLRNKARPLKEPADLARHVLLHDDPGGSRWPALPYLQWDVWLQAMGLPDLQVAGALHFSHYDQMIQAAANGEGVALGRLPLLSRQIREGRLVAPFEKARAAGRGTRSTRGYFMLATPGATARPEVRHFMDWLLSEARQEAAAR